MQPSSFRLSLLHRSAQIPGSDFLARFFLLSGVCGFLAAPQTAQGQDIGQLTTVYALHDTTGYLPVAPLVRGSDGSFYGTAQDGGAGDGTIFRVTPTGNFTHLYNFEAGDGYLPMGQLLQGSDGNFYGTTAVGGSGAAGTVFQVTPAGGFATIYNFAYPTSSGSFPLGNLVQDADGNFYGVTHSGGLRDDGVVYRLTLAGELTVLHDFQGQSSGDGETPLAGLVQGSDGNFYGTTGYGGTYGYGTVYQLTPQGVLTILHSFTGNDDGNGPAAPLVQGQDGEFYGTTVAGGTAGYGAIFKISAAGDFTLLHSIVGNEGGGPIGALLPAPNGNFYGATGSSNSNDQAATIFEITPAGVLTVLYNFGDAAGNVSALLAGPTTGSDGNLYGVTDNTIYKVSVSTQPAFFAGQTSLDDGVYYLSFATGNPFGYYSYLTDPHYIYHFDLGYEFVIDANDGKAGVYLYDFASGTFFYTSPTFPFPYLYDFTLNSVLYYFSDPNNPGRYNTVGVRYFYDFANGQVITK